MKAKDSEPCFRSWYDILRVRVPLCCTRKLLRFNGLWTVHRPSPTLVSFNIHENNHLHEDHLSLCDNVLPSHSPTLATFTAVLQLGEDHLAHPPKLGAWDPPGSSPSASKAWKDQISNCMLLTLDRRGIRECLLVRLPNYFQAGFSNFKCARWGNWMKEIGLMS